MHFYDKVTLFLRELGGNFTFIEDQYRLKVGGQRYCIDLLLHHRRLRCLVAVNVKNGKFVPEDVGKMLFLPYRS